MGISGRIAAYFLGSQITPLIAIAVLVAGIFALLVTPREEEPKVDITLVDIFIPYPGASARDVEAQVTSPAERLLSRISGVDHIVSAARPGAALITVQFVVGQDPTQALVRLQDTINASRDWLDPTLGIGEPLIKSRAIDDIPVFTATLWTRDPQRSAYDLGEVARSLEAEIKRIAGTRDVEIIGGPRRALRILLDPARLQAYGLAPLELRDKLLLTARSQTAGTLVNQDREILVRTGEAFQSADDVGRVIVAVHDGRPVFLSEVAKIIDGPDQPTDFVWFGPGPASSTASDGVYPAVTLTVSKMSGVNASALTATIESRLRSLRGVLIPDGVEFAITRDFGETAAEKSHVLIFKLAFITLLVTVMVLIVLGWRDALVIGIAVSLTLLMTLFASWAVGFTINRVSLFAVIFSVGFLVDDAIVVVENINRCRGLRPHDRLIDIIPRAVDEVGSPTILATFTVIFALMPLAVVPGLMGHFLRAVPINASMGMFLSLVIAFVITPWLTLHILSSGSHAKAHADAGAASKPGRMQLAFNQLTRRTIGLLIDPQRGRRRRRFLYAGVMLAILAALCLPAFKIVLLKLLSVDNQSEILVVLDMPVGTPVETTSNVLLEMSDVLQQIPEMTDYEIYAGTASPINLQGLVRQYYLRQSPELGVIHVNLLDREHRKHQSHEIAVSVRGRIEAIARDHGGDARLAEVPPGPPVVSPIVAEIYGPDYDGQKAVARFVRSAFESTPDSISIYDSLGGTGEQATLRIRDQKAALLGVNQTDIAEVLRMGLSGREVLTLSDTQLQHGVPIRLLLPRESADSMQQLLDLGARSASGELVPLSALVDIVPGTRDSVILHKDLRPVVYVFGDLGGKLDSPLYGMFDIRARLQQLAPNEASLPDGKLHDFLTGMPDIYDGYSVRWDGDWDITFKTFRNIGGAYVVGLSFIYLLLVAYFKSYVTPLLVMAPIPLTIIGVLPGHMLLGMRFTASSVIGMAALAGIMVRNSILLVQFIDEQVAAGTPLDDAVIDSTIARARPIGLAGLAAMLGGILLIDDPIFGGLATSLLFGVFAATALTLLLLPPLYHGLLQRRLKHQKAFLDDVQ
ncbi:MAG: acriflavin resistance protein [Hydrocarboniphaga sp.]|uniref:efflux RND transporter permease subunit n=1 Tax=Hydrocarboniphaga sp. TaxID=2033016 RepID=UPI00262F30B0|nr:efflux RND transporter permease subunit [Hydrocarboniphaga sp.]MDB5970063.1 acriflavin resistance protein [Hydrocarboniphaga sp.]